MKKKSIGVYLTGGLGNQLFQYAAALSVGTGSEVYFYEKIGKPRLNSQGKPELFSFDFSNAEKHKRLTRGNYITEKSAGYLLRSGIWPRKFENNKFVKFLTILAAAIVQSITLRQLIWPYRISEVGYEKIQVGRLRLFQPFLIGYFQSCVWADEVKVKLETLTLSKVGADLKGLQENAEKEKPIVIHIRRGDYKSESTFGLLDSDYYQRAMQILDARYPTNPVWVFSDDESEAREILSWLPEERLRFISDVDGESASSLMAMRLGCAYVIANSTFSWWGAYLSTSKNPTVIAPKPWFIGQKDPVNIIPENWISINR